MTENTELASSGAKGVTWRRRLAIAMVILVCIESSMQILAYLEYRASHRWYAFRADGAKRRVVCLGDGFTLGVGASTAADSYPAQLQLQLGEDWSVRNAGAIGRDSGAALQRLVELLAEDCPEVVCLAVGRVDAQTTMVEVQASRLAFAFEWQVQSLRWLRSAPAESDALAFVGDWHFGATLFRFAEDHSVSLAGLSGTWSYQDSRLVVRLANGDSIALSWSIEGEVLRIAGPFPGGEVVVFRGLPSPGVEREIEGMLRREAFAEAAWYCDIILRGANPTSGVRALRAEVAWLSGKPELALATLDLLEQELAGEDPKHLVARCRVTMGEQGAAEALDQYCRDHPEERLLGDDLAWRMGALGVSVDSLVTDAHIDRMVQLCASQGVRLVLVPVPGSRAEAEADHEGLAVDGLWGDLAALSVAGYGSDQGYERLAKLLAVRIKNP